MLFFGSTALIFRLLTTVLQDLSRFDLCFSQGAVACGISMQAIAQSITNVLFGYPSWYFWYFSYEGRADSLGKLMALGLIVLVVLASLLTFFAATGEMDLERVGVTWGVIATVSNIVMWWPQIFTTVELRDKGILSLWTLAMSILRDWIIATSLLWAEESFWVVLPYFPDSALQLVLIILARYYDRRRRNEALLEDQDTPLENPTSDLCANTVGVPPVPD